MHRHIYSHDDPHGPYDDIQLVRRLIKIWPNQYLLCYYASLPPFPPFRQDDHHQHAGHDHHLVALEYERHVHQADRGHLLDALNGPHVGLPGFDDHHTALKDGDNFAERVKMDREKGKKRGTYLA